MLIEKFFIQVTIGKFHKIEKLMEFFLKHTINNNKTFQNGRAKRSDTNHGNAGA